MRLQPQCFAAFGLKKFMSTQKFSMSCDCTSREYYFLSYPYIFIPNCVSFAFELFILLFCYIIRIGITSVVLVHTFPDHELSKWLAELRCTTITVWQSLSTRYTSFYFLCEPVSSFWVLEHKSSLKKLHINYRI